ncbi:hypothetical protein MTR_4g016060 [Medicago truncatula]|uniref:Uncharacterized protein n=1 Tax=Medicago truncatula TaxID=3880 RepID=A0A072USQ9_MEDTR|nr:hypothetical protein MTR_4g016060 [Medicago truncatula]
MTGARILVSPLCVVNIFDPPKVLKITNTPYFPPSTSPSHENLLIYYQKQNGYILRKRRRKSSSLPSPSKAYTFTGALGDDAQEKAEDAKKWKTFMTRQGTQRRSKNAMIFEAV